MDGILVVSCVALFLFFYYFAAGALLHRYKLVRNSVVNNVDYTMKSREKGILSYSEIKEKLDRNGVTYYSKGKITPFAYVVYNFGCVVAGAIVGIIYGVLPGAALGIAAYLLPDYYIRRRNEADNEKMMSDIMDMFDVISICAGSGEYITGILIDSYRVVRHPRLKLALIELTGSIVATNDVLGSIDEFAVKFDNENINNLCAVVKQMVELGSTDVLLKDIRRHLGILSGNYYEMTRIKVKKQGEFWGVAVFAGVILMITYSCFIGLGTVSALLGN